MERWTSEIVRAKQKELLKQFESESEAGTHPQSEGFLSKLKDFLSGEA